MSLHVDRDASVLILMLIVNISSLIKQRRTKRMQKILSLSSLYETFQRRMLFATTVPEKYKGA